MSRANKQSLILLASFAGCMGQILAKNGYARVDVKSRVEHCFVLSSEGIKNWPEDNTEDLDECVGKIRAWSDEMGKRQEYLSSATLVYMAGRILLNLEFKIKSRVKKKLLLPIREAFQPLADYVDPEGLNIIAFEEGDKMLDMLDELIGWETDNQVIRVSL